MGMAFNSMYLQNKVNWEVKQNMVYDFRQWWCF